MLNGGASRLTDRFVLGSRQFRGFEFAGIGPRDTAVPNEDSLGGNFYAVARFETEFPLGLPEEYGIAGGAFLDVGTLWGLDDTAGGLTGTDPVDDDLHLRAAIGLSLFWNTPIGPLRLNFSQALMKEDYDRVQNFDITVQTRF
jgi:outer membrane protein insertion porin family